MQLWHSWVLVFTVQILALLTTKLNLNNTQQNTIRITHHLREHIDYQSMNQILEWLKLTMLTQLKHTPWERINSQIWHKKNSSESTWTWSQEVKKELKNTSQTRLLIQLLTGPIWLKLRIKDNVVHAGHSLLLVLLNQPLELRKSRQMRICLNNN